MFFFLSGMSWSFFLLYSFDIFDYFFTAREASPAALRSFTRLVIALPPILITLISKDLDVIINYAVLPGGTCSHRCLNFSLTFLFACIICIIICLIYVPSLDSLIVWRRAAVDEGPRINVSFFYRKQFSSNTFAAFLRASFVSSISPFFHHPSFQLSSHWWRRLCCNSTHARRAKSWASTLRHHTRSHCWAVRAPSSLWPSSRWCSMPPWHSTWFVDECWGWMLNIKLKRNGRGRSRIVFFFCLFEFFVSVSVWFWFVCWTISLNSCEWNLEKK